MHLIRPSLIIAALSLYIALGVFPFLFSGLLAPASGVAILLAGWATGFIATVVLVRRGSLWAIAMPPLALAYWFAILILGEQLLGWTA